MSRVKMVAGAARHLRGWRKDRPDHRDMTMGAPTAIKLASRDVRLASALPPYLPFDQGQVGDCTANMGCAQMGFLAWKQGINEVFSRFNLYANTRALEGTPLAEDSGAEIRDVMKTLAKSGVCLEAIWPSTPESRFSAQPSEAAQSSALTHQALMYYRCTSIFAAKTSIAQGFPVGFGFSVPANMMSDACAQSGMVNYPAPNEDFDGGHAVTMIGYDDDIVIGSETGAAFCLNSWGPGWGLKGFFWLPYRFFTDKDRKSVV